MNAVRDPSIADQASLVRAVLCDRPVAYHPMMAKAFGGATAGLFLSQLFYWSNKGQDPEGWIYKTSDEWTEETGLTRHEQETARRHLREAGVLEEKREGMPARLFYKLTWDALINILVAENSETACRKVTSLLPKSDILVAENRQSLYVQRIRTENDPESTSEIPPDRRGPLSSSEDSAAATSSEDGRAVKSAQSEVRLVLDTLEALRGYQSPNYGGEGKATKWMLQQGYSPTQIIECYTHLKMDKFWADKSLTLMKVRAEIGEWQTSQRRGPQTSQRTNPGPPGRPAVCAPNYHATSFEAHKADYERRWGKVPEADAEEEPA